MDVHLQIELISFGYPEDMARLARELPDFPHGNDEVVGRPWIWFVVEYGSLLALQWVLDQGVALPTEKFDDGYTLLQCAIERKDGGPKYEVIRLLCEQGVDVDQIGFNAWTAAHLAACRNDVESLKILDEFGAGFGIASKDTWIDEGDLPADTASKAGSMRAFRYLRGKG